MSRYDVTVVALWRNNVIEAVTELRRHQHLSGWVCMKYFVFNEASEVW